MVRRIENTTRIPDSYGLDLATSHNGQKPVESSDSSTRVLTTEVSPLLEERVYIHTKFSFFPDRALLKLNNGRQKILTPTQRRILQFLLERSGVAVSREELIRGVWGDDVYSAGTLQQQIHRLRQKIEDRPNNQEIIISLRGFGYKLEDRSRDEEKVIFDQRKVEGNPPRESSEEVVHLQSGLIYHPKSGIIEKDGREIIFTPIERDIFSLLVANPNRVMPYYVFYQNILKTKGDHADVTSPMPSLERHINAIRRKIEDQHQMGKLVYQHINVVKGQGYILGQVEDVDLRVAK